MKKHRKQYFACILCLFFAVSVFGGGLISSGMQWEFQSYADEDRAVAPVENAEQGSEIADGENSEDEAVDTDTADVLDADKLLDEIREEIEKLPAIEDLDQLTNEELDTLTADLAALQEKLKSLEELLQADDPEAAALSLLTEEEQAKYEAIVEAVEAVADEEESTADAKKQDAPKKKKVVALASDDGSGNGLSIETGFAQETAEGSNVYAFPNLAISVPEGRNVASVTIQFTSAIQSGDSINLNNQDGFTLLDGSKNGNVTVNADDKTKEEWEDYLRNNLTISLSNVSVTRKLRFSASLKSVDAIYDYNSENGHYYLAVNKSTSWTAAREAAAASTYLGMQGYLATITSKEEQDFLTSLIHMNTWLGGTCYPDYLNGLTLTLPNGKRTAALYSRNDRARYFWATGPEAGLAFWEGSLTASQNGTAHMYTNWAAGEPNDTTTYGEFCVHMYVESGKKGTWNDFPNSVGCGYIIEYGGMPGDGDSSSDSDSTVEVNLDPTGRTLSTKVKEILMVGEPLGISSSFNGKDAAELLPKNLEIRYTFYKKNEAGKYEALPDGEEPFHPGEYKVESKVYEEETGKQASGYTGDAKKFTIKARELTVEEIFTKVYDGTTDFYPGGDIALTGIVPGLDKVAFSYRSGSYNDENVANANTVYLEEAVLTGDNAQDYIIKTDDEKRLAVKGTITPKPITITVNSSVTSSKAKQKIDPAPVYTNDLNDDMLVEGEQIALFGEPEYVGPITDSDVELDLVSPAAGTYKVNVTFPNMDETAKSNYAVTYKPATIEIKKPAVIMIPDIDKEPEEDDKPNINIDTDDDGKPDLNIDTDDDGKPDINIDTDDDGEPDINIDTNGDGKPDINIDIDGDGIPDLNIDTDGDGIPDLNIDADEDEIPDVNVDTDGDDKPDKNIDKDYKSKYDKDDAAWHYPKTSDESNLAMWFSLLGTSLLALGAVALLILRRNPVKK